MTDAAQRRCLLPQPSIPEPRHGRITRFQVPTIIYLHKCFVVPPSFQLCSFLNYEILTRMASVQNSSVGFSTSFPIMQISQLTQYFV